MNESYKELIVKKEMGAKEIVLRTVCVVPTVLFALLSLAGVLIALVGAGIFGVLTYFVWISTDIEYEYLYLDKELNVDKIMAKSRRKKVATLEVERMEIMAPEKSHQLDSYRNRDFKKVDYSAGKDLPEMKLYTIYYDGSQKIQVNLTEDFVKTIKAIAPRKVFLD